MKVGQIWSVEYGGQKYGVRVTETRTLSFQFQGLNIESVRADFIKPGAGFTHATCWVSDTYPHPPHWTLIEDVP